MKLDSMLAGLAVPPAGADKTEITNVTADSRHVGPGSLFAALAGSKADGAAFAADAVAGGAAAIITAQTSQLQGLPVPIIRVDDPRRALALLAARFYARQPETIVAVTGTSGKTSVADFARQIFTALGHASASIGTIGIIRPDGSIYGSLTTPDPVTLHLELAGLADVGVTHMAFEASSHGLDQRRLDGVAIKAAAFTNLGHDHLDYHPTVEQYFAAKRRLFDTLLPHPLGADGFSSGAPGTAVINSDTPEGRSLVETCNGLGLSVLRVGEVPDAELRLIAAEPAPHGQDLIIAYAGESYEVALNLIGRYQGANAMLAAGLAIAVGEPASSVFGALGVLEGVRGRLEVVSSIRGALVVIDYAHKPDALVAALDALRPFATNRLICLFGCGGDRDRAKRPVMGRIAAQKADMVVVTDDNPRSENAASIRAEIMSACPGAKEIADRYEAIGYAMMQLGPGDVLVVAGKGHETGQIIGDEVLPFSDHDAVEAVSIEL